MVDKGLDLSGETLRVGKADVGVEGRLVDPLGVNEVDQGTSRRFIQMDAQAAGFGARGLQNAPQFVTQL